MNLLAARHSQQHSLDRRSSQSQTACSFLKRIPLSSSSMAATRTRPHTSRDSLISLSANNEMSSHDSSRGVSAAAFLRRRPARQETIIRRLAELNLTATLTADKVIISNSSWAGQDARAEVDGSGETLSHAMDAQY